MFGYVGKQHEDIHFFERRKATVADPALSGQLGLQMGIKSTENSGSNEIQSKVFDWNDGEKGPQKSDVKCRNPFFFLWWNIKKVKSVGPLI